MGMTTILVAEETRNSLKNEGIKGQTYDHVIRDLIEFRRSMSTNGHGREARRKPL